MKYFLTSLLVLTLSPAVAAAEPLEQQLVDRLTTLQLQLERLADTRRDLLSQRAKLSDELNRLSAEIEREKLNRPLDGLLPSPGLENRLRRVKAISEELQQLSHTLAELEAARDQQSRELLGVLERLIEFRTEALARLSPAQRNRVLSDVASLRRQYDALAQQLSRRPLFDPGTLPSFEASEDEQELREQIDAVSDARDRLRRQLDRLDEAIGQTRSRLRLEQRLQQFISDQELFGENRTSPFGVAAAAPKVGSNETPPGGYQDGSLDANSAAEGGGLPLPPPAPDEARATADGAHPEQQLKQLEQERRQLVEEIKRLQVYYDRLQERLEQIK